MWRYEDPIYDHIEITLKNEEKIAMSPEGCELYDILEQADFPCNWRRLAGR